MEEKTGKVRLWRGEIKRKKWEGIKISEGEDTVK
jgi:hypothetical protein